MFNRKIKAASSDFKESELPKTRKEQFFDILKIRFTTLLKIGLWLLVFAIPFLGNVCFKDLSITNIYVNLADNVITKEEALKQINTVTTTFNFINIFAVLIMFIGLAGFLRVYRDLLFEDSLFFKDSFSLGLKQNIKQLVIVGLFLGLFIFAINSFYNSKIINSVVAAIIIGILVVLILPMLLYLCAYITLYSDKLIFAVKNAMLLYLRTIPKMLLFTGLLVLPVLLSLFNVIIIKLPILVLLVIFVLPIYILAFMCFSYSEFDKHINKNQYPDLIKKGLYEEN